MPYELVQQYWLAWVVMLSPRALTTTSESGNSRRAAMDNGESAGPTERACTMSSSVTSTHLPHTRINEHLHHDWFYDYKTDEGMEGPALAPPVHHPLKQPTPGPAGKVPRDWQSYLH